MSHQIYSQPLSHSNDSIRRFSSNNPFRNLTINNTSTHSNLNTSTFNDWVDKNKKLLDLSDDDSDIDDKLSLRQDSFKKPARPVPPMRINSDNLLPVRFNPELVGRSISSNSGNTNNQRRKMSPSSNNPFASALEEPDSYVHHRAPPPPPPPSNYKSRSSTPKDLPPPSYDEISKKSNSSEYPREKLPSSSANLNLNSRLSPPVANRERRSNSDTRPREHRSHRSDHGAKDSQEYKEYREQRDRRRREEKEGRREHRSSRDRKSSSSRKKDTPVVKPKNLDTIDKLDVTSFFGGAGFHHDGPFDACTPHRNKNVKAAPVQAFPVDGPNSSIKGMGPVSKDHQLNLAFGTFENDEELYTPRITRNEESGAIKTGRTSSDLKNSLYIPKHDPSVVAFDSNTKAPPIHGSVTDGLGSSTFVDGAPAPKAYQSEEVGGGLGRKKSLVQRLRKNSEPRKMSDDYDEYEIQPSTTNSLLQRVKSLKVGRSRN